MKLDVRNDYLECNVVKDYIERVELGLEDTNRTLSEYLIDKYELLSFQQSVNDEIINSLQSLLMKIKHMDSTSDEVKKEIDNTVVGIF